MDQRFQIGAHQHIGRGLLGLRVQLDSQRMRRTRHYLVLHIGDEAQLLLLPCSLDL
ncbi:hypothetical protein D3C85_1853700 [compost metagenome]